MWIKHTMQNDYHKEAIAQALEDNFFSTIWENFDKKLTITDVLERYPRLGDFKGEMASIKL